MEHIVESSQPQLSKIAGADAGASSKEIVLWLMFGCKFTNKVLELFGGELNNKIFKLVKYKHAFGFGSPCKRRGKLKGNVGAFDNICPA